LGRIIVNGINKNVTNKKELSNMKMTKAFIRNISDDIITGLGDTILEKYNAHNKPSVLIENKKGIVEYTQEMVELWTAICADCDQPFYYLSKIKSYKLFIEKNTEGK
tara:strand:- start:400 stop:720 length:321 start_codon:yes stop_codon:yes gene_type:complete